MIKAGIDSIEWYTRYTGVLSENVCPNKWALSLISVNT